MTCQRCGSCCFSMAVVVRVGEGAYLKPVGVLCPYLEFDDSGPGLAVCTVHGEPWFRQTSCCAWGDAQLDPSGAFQRERPCAVGSLVRSSLELRGKLRAAPRTAFAELEYLGSWAMVRK